MDRWIGRYINHYKKATHLKTFRLTNCSAISLTCTFEINYEVLNENLHMGIITYIQDCCYNYDI